MEKEKTLYFSPFVEEMSLKENRGFCASVNSMSVSDYEQETFVW